MMPKKKKQGQIWSTWRISFESLDLISLISFLFSLDTSTSLKLSFSPSKLVKMWTASRVCSSRHAALLKRFIQLDACHRKQTPLISKEMWMIKAKNIPNSKEFQTSFHGQPTGWVENKQPDPKHLFSARPWSWHGNCCWRSFLSFSPPGIKRGGL